MALFCKNQQEIDRAVDTKIISLKNENDTLKVANNLLLEAKKRLNRENNKYNSVDEINFGKFCKNYIGNKKDIYTDEVITNLKEDVKSFMGGKIYQYKLLIFIQKYVNKILVDSLSGNENKYLYSQRNY